VKYDAMTTFQGQEYELIEHARKSRRSSIIRANSNRAGPMLKVDSFSVEYRYSFLDFIAGGVTLNFAVAIDFTRSNGMAKDHNKV
jgi:hypothetical protein